MSVVIYLAIFMIFVGAFFLVIFLFAVKNGQFDDLESPAHKILLDDDIEEADKKQVIQKSDKKHE
ncbi:cbb3-type cytochrome oxidase assembly protein CcoS [Pigmentibacter sp. JX0631]|uniref:cbb3-type cytochrome oxidase assembly protein CcoS n=1 Tax=Pigmentibacter sp. JX0631 TaxID=2976982 RepID=UPI00246949CF|nr:cbb3-type cytochrome oxidase assembly protein CcoS [Pigmentibacter sp. JX0631]WGL59679.1 cbb3-type cytochrome oxidase assembly protein CcoS [Pigmentibacter sp. JX0631]